MIRNHPIADPPFRNHLRPAARGQLAQRPLRLRQPLPLQQLLLTPLPLQLTLLLLLPLQQLLLLLLTRLLLLLLLNQNVLLTPQGLVRTGKALKQSISVSIGIGDIGD